MSEYWEAHSIPAQYLTHVPEGATVRLEITDDDGDGEGSFASGDDHDDAQVRMENRSQLSRGNLWAWCIVRVTVTDGDAEGMSYLGGVSYWWTDDTPNDVAIARAFMADSGRDLLDDALTEYRAECARLAVKYAPTA